MVTVRVKAIVVVTVAVIETVMVRMTVMVGKSNGDGNVTVMVTANAMMIVTVM